MGDRLDLDEYGIGHLKGKSVLHIGESDVRKYLDALGKEDRSVHLPISPTPENILRLVSQSDCRRCGRCCMPNPLNPTHPGVEVFESEIRPIARHLHTSRKKIKSKTTRGKSIINPLDPTESEMTRRFPLPCPFFISRSRQCHIYPVRPIICKTYPVLSGDSFSDTEVKVNCDYGKDIVIHAISALKQRDSGIQILI